LRKAVPVPDFPKIPKGKAPDVLISPAQQKRPVAPITDECYRDAVDFKFATGWRGNEVRTLQWK
jgi:hypothetical protein